MRGKFIFVILIMSGLVVAALSFAQMTASVTDQPLTPEELAMAQKMGFSCITRIACATEFETNFTDNVAKAKNLGIYTEPGQVKLADTLLQDNARALLEAASTGDAEAILQATTQLLQNPKLQQQLAKAGIVIKKEEAQAVQSIVSVAIEEGHNLETCTNPQAQLTDAQEVACARIFRAAAQQNPTAVKTVIGKNIEHYEDMTALENIIKNQGCTSQYPDVRTIDGCGEKLQLAFSSGDPNALAPFRALASAAGPEFVRMFDEMVAQGQQVAIRETRRGFAIPELEVGSRKLVGQAAAQACDKAFLEHNVETARACMEAALTKAATEIEKQQIIRGWETFEGMVSSGVNPQTCFNDPRACSAAIPEGRQGDFAVMQQVENVFRQVAGSTDPAVHIRAMQQALTIPNLPPYMKAELERNLTQSQQALQTQTQFLKTGSFTVNLPPEFEQYNSDPSLPGRKAGVGQRVFTSEVEMQSFFDVLNRLESERISRKLIPPGGGFAAVVSCVRSSPVLNRYLQTTENWAQSGGRLTFATLNPISQTDYQALRACGLSPEAIGYRLAESVTPPKDYGKYEIIAGVTSEAQCLTYGGIWGVLPGSDVGGCYRRPICPTVMPRQCEPGEIPTEGTCGPSCIPSLPTPGGILTINPTSVTSGGQITLNVASLTGSYYLQLQPGGIFPISFAGGTASFVVPSQKGGDYCDFGFGGTPQCLRPYLAQPMPLGIHSASILDPQGKTIASGASISITTSTQPPVTYPISFRGGSVANNRSEAEAICRGMSPGSGPPSDSRYTADQQICLSLGLPWGSGGPIPPIGSQPPSPPNYHFMYNTTKNSAPAFVFCNDGNATAASMTLYKILNQSGTEIESGSGCHQFATGVGQPPAGQTNKTWAFKDGGTQFSSILSRTDTEYTNFIAQKDAATRVGYFGGWEAGAGDPSQWQKFGIPLISATPSPPPTGSRCDTDNTLDASESACTGAGLGCIWNIPTTGSPFCASTRVVTQTTCDDPTLDFNSATCTSKGCQWYGSYCGPYGTQGGACPSGWIWKQHTPYMGSCVKDGTSGTWTINSACSAFAYDQNGWPNSCTSTGTGSDCYPYTTQSACTAASGCAWSGTSCYWSGGTTSGACSAGTTQALCNSYSASGCWWDSTVNLCKSSTGTTTGTCPSGQYWYVPPGGGAGSCQSATTTSGCPADILAVLGPCHYMYPPDIYCDDPMTKSMKPGGTVQTGCNSPTGTTTQTCPAGQYWYVPPAGGPGYCQSSTTTTCPSGQYWYVPPSGGAGYCQSTTTTTCPSGQWWDTTTNTCKSSTTTSSCGTGYWWDSTTNTCKSSCPSDQWWDSATNTCKSSTTTTGCPTGYWWDSATSACKPSSSTICPSDQWWDSATNTCKTTTTTTTQTCPEGQYWDTAAASCKSSCASGQVWDSTTHTCKSTTAALNPFSLLGNVLQTLFDFIFGF